MALPGGRWASSTRPCWSKSATATTSTTFTMLCVGEVVASLLRLLLASGLWVCSDLERCISAGNGGCSRCQLQALARRCSIAVVVVEVQARSAHARASACIPWLMVIDALSVCARHAFCQAD
jgi:hypothetical protein